MKKRVAKVKQKSELEEEDRIKITEGTYKKRGVEYSCFFVRGWKEKGKWQRKQFSTLEKAQAEVAKIKEDLKNDGKKRRNLSTTLSESQLRRAELAIDELGDIYRIEDVVAYFLKYNRAPDFEITILDGMAHFQDAKERKGLRKPSLLKIATVLKRFAAHTDNMSVHKVTEEDIVSYLESLRGKDGVSYAKRKSWNNHRNELSSFFVWAQKKDKRTNRPWTFHNPVEDVERHSSERVAEERPEIETTSPEQVMELMTYVMRFREGRLAKWFALAYFAGIRPSTYKGELSKLAEREDELINLTTGMIRIPAIIAKTKRKRNIRMSKNLIAWMKAYEGMPIIPSNLKNDYRHIRKKFGLQDDEPRHSFISYQVALHRSLGDAAMQAGNSERMIEEHYLNLHTVEQGTEFFSIIPDMGAAQAVLSGEKIETPKSFKVI